MVILVCSLISLLFGFLFLLHLCFSPSFPICWISACTYTEPGLRMICWISTLIAIADVAKGWGRVSANKKGRSRLDYKQGTKLGFHKLPKKEKCADNISGGAMMWGVQECGQISKCISSSRESDILTISVKLKRILGSGSDSLGLRKKSLTRQSRPTLTVILCILDTWILPTQLRLGQ